MNCQVNNFKLGVCYHGLRFVPYKPEIVKNEDFLWLLPHVTVTLRPQSTLIYIQKLTLVHLQNVS